MTDEKQPVRRGPCAALEHALAYYAKLDREYGIALDAIEAADGAFGTNREERDFDYLKDCYDQAAHEFISVLRRSALEAPGMTLGELAPAWWKDPEEL